MSQRPNPRSLAGEHVPEDPQVIEATRAELAEALAALEPYLDLTTDPRWHIIEEWSAYREREATESMLRNASFEEYIERRGMVVAYRQLASLRENVASDIARIRAAMEATEEDES